MSKAERTPQSPIKGLTAEQVDWSLYDNNKREHLRLFGSFENDFFWNAEEARRKALGKLSTTRIGRSPRIIKTSRLEAFLKAKRPPILFFQPQDIASLLNPNSNIAVEHKETAGLETWKFTLNSEKYKMPNEQEQSITLTRGIVKNGEPEPYLIIGFFASYNSSDGSVCFSPNIERTEGDSWQRTAIDEAMLTLLGIERTSIPRLLSFTVKKEHVRLKTGKDTFQEWDTYPVHIDLAKETKMVSTPSRSAWFAL